MTKREQRAAMIAGTQRVRNDIVSIVGTLIPVVDVYLNEPALPPRHMSDPEAVALAEALRQVHSGPWSDDHVATLLAAISVLNGEAESPQ